MSSDAMVVPVVSACIVQGRSVLLSKRLTSREPSIIGKWEFPGGVVHYGETLEEALKREIYEELRLLIEPLEVLHAQVNTYDSDTNYLVVCCKCILTLTAKWDVDFLRGSLAWVNPLSIIEGEWDVLPGTVKAAERLLRRPSFSFLETSAVEQTIDDTLRILTYEVGRMNELVYKGELYGTEPNTPRNFPEFLLKHQTADAQAMLRMFCEHKGWSDDEMRKLGEQRYLARQADLVKHATTPRLKVKRASNK